MQLKWLRRALDELDEAAAYVAQDNPQIAGEMYWHIKRRIEVLRQFPELGRPGRVPGTRELVIDRFPFLVPYRIVGSEVQILRIFHTRRKPPRKW